MAVAGFDRIAIGSEAESTWGSTRIELALVLDNTGSMNEAPGGKRKIDALKTGARDLLDTLRGVAHDQDTVKVSIVPFDTEVRLETRYNTAEWLRWSNPADRLAWTGYVIDRDQPNDASDALPKTSDPKTLYPAVRESQWKAMGDIVPSHLMDRNLYPFTTLQTTGVVNPGGDRAFDEEDDCGTPQASAIRVRQPPENWSVRFVRSSLRNPSPARILWISASTR